MPRTLNSELGSKSRDQAHEAALDAKASPDRMINRAQRLRAEKNEGQTRKLEEQALWLHE
jgi:hypothetical protein